MGIKQVIITFLSQDVLYQIGVRSFALLYKSETERYSDRRKIDLAENEVKMKRGVKLLGNDRPCAT